MTDKLKVRRVRTMTVIEVETVEGTGEEGDPTRPVYSYWEEGKHANTQPIAVRDHWKDEQNGS